MPCYQGTGLGCPVALLAGFPSKVIGPPEKPRSGPVSIVRTGRPGPETGTGPGTHLSTLEAVVKNIRPLFSRVKRQ